MMLMAVVWTAIFVVVSAAVIFAHDIGVDLPVARLMWALVVALLLSGVVYAAEVYAPDVCNLYEKYSFMWYVNGCFFGEHSS